MLKGAAVPAGGVGCGAAGRGAADAAGGEPGWRMSKGPAGAVWSGAGAGLVWGALAPPGAMLNGAAWARALGAPIACSP